MPSAVDDVLAFTAWFAFHAIPVRANCDHPLLREMPWNLDNCEVLDKAADSLLNPEGYNDLHNPREAHDIFSKLPANAHRYALRLLFCELALTPLSANPQSLLKSVQHALQSVDQVLPEALENPGQLGQFLYGRFGLILRKNKAKTAGRMFQGGYGNIIATLPEALGWSGRSVSGARLIHPSEGWSDRQLLLWNRQKLLDPEFLQRGQLLFSLTCSREWVDGVPREAGDKGFQALLLGRMNDVTALIAVLKACLESDRKDFFAGTETWQYAPDAKNALEALGKTENDNDPARLPRLHQSPESRELRQLMLMTNAELMYRCINDCGCVPEDIWSSQKTRYGLRLVPEWAARQVFSINLARALIQAYERVGRLDDLDELLTAKGERLQRVLHYVLRLGPERVLRNRLQEPRIASA